MTVHTFRVRTKIGGVLLALGLLSPALATGTAAATSAHPRAGIATTGAPTPVINANFADPDILLVDGVYNAYATNSGGQNIQHQVSTDLKHWTAKPDALPVLGDWVGPCSFAPGGATDHCIWAPEVSAVDGHYVMYYTARDKLAPFQCIGVATSMTPDGPFVPVGSNPLVCPDGTRGAADLGGAIDASTYKENGQLYLLWKADGNCCAGKAAIIFIQPLSADGLTLTGPATELIRVTQRFEGNVVEAPTLVKHNGTYYLFYSANDFGGGNYRTNYATSASIMGPYTKSLRELMTTDLFHGTVIGPGGQDVFTNKLGTTSIVFHGWDPTYSYRAMYSSELVWSDAGVPTVRDADVRYQAEDGVVVDARVVPDNSASGEAKVGGMDNLDSSVTLRINAPKSGPAVLGIRYGNGSLDSNGNGVAATDSVLVNGMSAGIVTLPNTAWGNWTMQPYGVTLTKGWNTVTFTKLTYYAEIDAVDLYYGPAPRVSHDPMGDPATAVRYEAEAGVITHANVVQDARASAGAKVGGLDFLDSSVTFTINVATAGVKTLRIRFDNGSLDRSGYPVVATDTVTVNGVAARNITFQNTTWGNWETVDSRVRLHAGANTVTFTKATFYTELDAVDVF